MRTHDTVAAILVFEANSAKAETFVQSGNVSNPILAYRSAKGYAAEVVAQL
jgi:hypothetical protein